MAGHGASHIVRPFSPTFFLTAFGLADHMCPFAGCPGMSIYNFPFHFQKWPNLDNTLYSHPGISEVGTREWDSP